MRQLTLQALCFSISIPLVASGCGVTESGQSQPGRPAGTLAGALPDKAAPVTAGLVRLSPESARYISTEPVEAGRDPVPLRLPARLEFKDGAVSEVGAPMAGRIGSVMVRTGDRVRVGDPLAVVSCPEAASARTGLATAEGALKEAPATLDRQKRMFDMWFGIERDRLAAEIHLVSAQAEADRARSTVSFIGGGHGADVTVRSPIAGVVLSVKATPGATVTPGGDPLIEVGDPTSLLVVVDAPERELPRISVGAPATIELTSQPGALAAKVTSIGAVVSNGLRTAPLRMALTLTPAGLRPGMYGWARLETADSGPTLPTEAVLIKDGKESIVYVARDDRTFERRPVVVGRPLDGRVPLLSGVVAGEKVVVRGALLLDGSAEQLL